MAKRIKSPYKAWRRYRNRENTCTTLHKVFDYATTNYAKRIAFQYVDGGQQYTYAEFRTKTERLSQRMSRFGIKHGDRVAIFSQNMPNWVVAFFAATAFGRVAVPSPTARNTNSPISSPTRNPKPSSFPSGCFRS